MLIDIGLPKMNGVEFLEKVNKEYKQYEDTLKIAVTAHVMKTEMDNYIGKGFYRIISKPFRLQQFRDVIVSTLNPENLYGGELISNNAVCKRPSKATFVCKPRSLSGQSSIITM